MLDCAYLVLADAARRRRDGNAAESALAAASAKLWEWSLHYLFCRGARDGC